MGASDPLSAKMSVVGSGGVVCVATTNLPYLIVNRHFFSGSGLG